MKRLRLDLFIPIIFLLLAAFSLGFIVDDVRASNGNTAALMSSLRLLPQRLVSTAGTPQTDSDQPLHLMDTYSTTMERLKSDYYGKPIKERELTYDAIRGMLHALGDPFTRFLDPDSYREMREENEGNFTGIGAQLGTNKDGEIYVREPMPNTPAKRAGIKSNDVITGVNGKPIHNMAIEDVIKLIRGPQDTKVKLTLRRKGVAKPIVLSIVRQIVQLPMVKVDMLDQKNGIGYIRLYQFNEMSDTQFDEALSELEKKNLKGLVFDLRGNPGGLLTVAIEIGSRFLESGPVVIIQERDGHREPRYVEEDHHNHKRYPVAVLVDKTSASASEIVSGAIKDTGSGTLVGTTTFGKGRVQIILPLQDGSAVAVTKEKYLTPNGTDIHKKGIDPDIWVEASENFDPDDRKTDVQLTKAISVVKVKLGLLPQSVLDKMKSEGKTAKKAE